MSALCELMPLANTNALRPVITCGVTGMQVSPSTLPLHMAGAAVAASAAGAAEAEETIAEAEPPNGFGYA